MHNSNRNGSKKKNRNIKIVVRRNSESSHLISESIFQNTFKKEKRTYKYKYILRNTYHRLLHIAKESTN